MSQELKPCPFCGGNSAFNEHDDECYFTVLKNVKAAPRGDISGMIDLLAAWNRRHEAKQPAGSDVARDAEDTKRLDALAMPGWELSMNNDPECWPDELWQVHRVSGGRNDREWHLIGQGANPRAAIDAAIATHQQRQDGGEVKP